MSNDDPKPTPGLAAFALAGAAGVVPGFAAELNRRLEIEDAAVYLAAIVGPKDLERYLAELERRWVFVLETARTTTRWIQPDKAALIRSMAHEIAAGIL